MNVVNRINEMIIVDYNDNIILLDNGSMKSDFSTFPPNQRGEVNLTTNFNSFGYDLLRNFCDEYHEKFTIQTSPITNYKKEIKIVFNDFNMLLYGAFVRKVNFNENDQIDVCLSYDHVIYNLESIAFENYTPYIRMLKLKKIQEQMKKELIMN